MVNKGFHIPLGCHNRYCVRLRALSTFLTPVASVTKQCYLVPAKAGRWTGSRVSVDKKLNVCLRATESEISAALWDNVACGGLYILPLPPARWLWHALLYSGNFSEAILAGYTSWRQCRFQQAIDPWWETIASINDPRLLLNGNDTQTIYQHHTRYKSSDLWMSTPTTTPPSQRSGLLLRLCGTNLPLTAIINSSWHTISAVSV